ncbi:tRNA (adenosine(37)-N6)-dimethylallyltransferase MiaA [Oleisolibacter albus]|uniref:tRNA (adenosine(37)-N6)-dimethylallyltransferase MiaA n=1 Tax=Oleisolibacter albus TaxID=2171757 RepID=UPI000DF2661C|nr:tRNA (adenosine(37)-N6)-dimethylallyltransferase MiaA [Oleisolibacter albus]
MAARTAVLVIGGPTASGKSGLALALAERAGGTVINADSMQVYDLLRVVTARPDAAEMARAPHRLYGVVSPAVRMSAAAWRDLALAEIRAARDAGRLPIVVGGTGLYLRTLMHGIADIPDIPAEVRAAALALQQQVGSPGLHALLAGRDPETAARLAPGDTQRLVRAWEVLEATGRSIRQWQAQAAADRPADLAFLTVVADPPRDRLYARCDRRFLQMLEQGALEEVRQLDRLGLDPELPAMKALGVPELRGLLQGRLDLATATATAQQMTRNYAKRQVTWFRHQLVAAHRVDPADLSASAGLEKFYDQIMAGMTQIISSED